MSAFARNNSIDGTASVYDSRDIIARIESLQEDNAELILRYTLSQRVGKGFGISRTMDCSYKPTEEEQDILDELTELLKLANECEDYADWQHGETLIARSYWVKYIKELINDCYELPKEIDSGKWPYRHMQMDYESAAEEAEQDYTKVILFGNEYLIRNNEYLIRN